MPAPRTSQNTIRLVQRHPTSRLIATHLVPCQAPDIRVVARETQVLSDASTRDEFVGRRIGDLVFHFRKRHESVRPSPVRRQTTIVLTAYIVGNIVSTCS